MSKPIKIYNPKVATLIAVTFIFTVVLNYLYEKPLYLLGVDIIRGMQAHRNLFHDTFFLLVTMLIDPSIVVLAIVALLVLSKNKKKAFLMTLFVIFNTYCAAILKAYHIDPRPIWTHYGVKNIGLYCPIQYGNPSGHSWFSAIIGFVFIFEYFGNGKYNQNFLIAILFCIIVPMSRMYLGAHSLDQVLYGLSMGLQMCILFSIQLKYTLEQFMFNFSSQRRWKLLIVLLHGISLVPYVVNYNNEIPQVWIDNIFVKCKKEVNEESLNFLMLSVNCMLVNIAAGIGYAYHQLVADKHGRYYLSGNWRINRQKYGRYLGYVVYIGIQVGFLFSGFALGFCTIKISTNKLLWYISLGCGALISGYVYTKYTIRMMGRLELIQQGRRKVSSAKQQ